MLKQNKVLYEKEKLNRFIEQWHNISKEGKRIVKSGYTGMLE